MTNKYKWYTFVTCQKNIIGNFYKNIGLLLILNALIKPFGLYLESLVHKSLGQEIWGTYAALNSIAFVLVFLTDPGINQFVTKTIAESPDLLRKIFPNLFIYKLIILPVYPIVFITLAYVLGFRDEDLIIALIVSGVYILINITGFMRASLQGHQLFSQDAWASNFDKLTLSILILVMFQTGTCSLENFVSIKFLSVAITVLLLFWLLIKNKIWIKPKLHKKHAIMFASMSAPFAWMTILYSANERIDMIMIHELHSAYETGIYNAAYRILDAAMMYLWVILPFFFAKLAHFDSTDEEKDKLINNGTAITATPLIILSVFSFFYGENLFFMFSQSKPEDIIYMKEYFIILSTSLLIHGFFAILSTYLTSNGHTRFVNKMIFISILLNLTLNYFFIPQFGGKAAAITTLISSSFLSFSYISYIKRRTNIKFPLKTWGILLFISLAGFCTYSIGELIHLHWIVNSLIASTIMLSISLITKIIRFNNMFKEDFNVTT